MELNEIDQSAKTAELTLSAQEAADIDEAFDWLVSKQLKQVDLHPDEPLDAIKLERYLAWQDITAEGTIEITVSYVHDVRNALSEKIYRMELLGQNQEDATKYARMQALLEEIGPFLDDFVPTVSDAVALRRQTAGK